MGVRPSNFFKALSGVPVLYDRLKPEHYGKEGVSYQFHCTDPMEATLEAFVGDLFERTRESFGAPQKILSAGAWVDKPGQHGLGKAFDLDAIHWERVRFVALEQPTSKPLYLVVQAIANKHFGVTLGYDYNPAHHDHLHLDIGRSVGFRVVSSVTQFLQQALNTFYGHTLHVDGEFGDSTETALNATLAALGIPDLTSVQDWAKFLDAICKQGIARVVATLGAVPGERISAVTAIDGAEVWAAMAHLDADPMLPMRFEAAIASPGVLATRPHTGRIDLGYKPFPNWTISSKTVSGKEQWFVDFDRMRQVYLGYKFRFEQRYEGLARTGSAAAAQVPYEHQSYRSQFGDWASLIYPTGRCESEAQFLVVNSWDAAAMTFGFFQMAAHTGEHLASLFRELLGDLPDEAEKFFPELKLGHQIGEGESTHIFAVNGADRLDLDIASTPTDGLHAERYYRGRFMAFFNPDRGHLDPEELAAAARWIAWMTTSAKARDICVRNAVNGAKRTVKRVHAYLVAQHHAKYPDGLHGVAMDLVAAAMDVKHHGRNNRDLGQTTDQSIFSALVAVDPLANFAKIDTDWREDRSRRSVKEIREMQPWFIGKTYDVATESFL